VAGYILKWFTHPPTVRHPSINPAMHGRESSSHLVDHKSITVTTTRAITRVFKPPFPKCLYLVKVVLMPVISYRRYFICSDWVQQRWQTASSGYYHAFKWRICVRNWMASKYRNNFYAVQDVASQIYTARL